MDGQTLRTQLEALQAELARNEEERGHLLSAVKSFEGLLRVYGASNGKSTQLAMPIQQPGRGGKPKGTISFRKGMAKALRDARGESLVDTEIWARMKALGVVSEATNPIGFVNLTGRRITEAERVKSGTWRWAGD